MLPLFPPWSIVYTGFCPVYRRGQDTDKNSGSHVGPSGANFGRAHQIPVAHLIAYIFPSYVKT